jgi:TnpA family transposase
LRILSEEEVEALFGLPSFPPEDRPAAFLLSQAEQNLLPLLRTVPSQLLFILQLGYFKAKQLFFTFRFEDVEPDVAYLLAQYFPQIPRTALRQPNKRTVLRHHRLLLALSGYRTCSAAERERLAARASQAARISSKPVYVFRALLATLAEQRIVAPGYTVLQDIVAAALREEQARLVAILRIHLTPADCTSLDALLAPAGSLYPITLLKREPKDFSLGEIRQEIGRLDHLRPLARLADLVLPHLAISNEGITYYASLAAYYSVFRLKQLATWSAYLYLLCFAVHRYHRLHDHLLTCFLYRVKQYSDEAKVVAKEQVYAQRLEDTQDLPKVGEVLTLFTSDQFGDNTPFGEVQAQAFSILARPRLAHAADRLAKATPVDETALQWEHVAVLARRFKQHLRPILLAVDIAAIQSDAPILEAIAFLKECFGKERPLTQRAPATFPTRCIPKRLRRYLVAQEDAGPKRLQADRYEFCIYRLLRHGLEAGDLSCRQSVRFRSFEDDVLSDEQWRHKETLLAEIGLPILLHPMRDHLADLERQLEERILAVNRRIAASENAHFQITRRGATPRWTLAYPRANDPVNHPLFDALPQQDIDTVLHFVQERCGFLGAFDHLLGRYVKSVVDDRVIRACLVAWGTNMGLWRMSEVSDIPYQTIVQTSENFIRLETLKAANDCVSNATAALPITHHYDLSELVHSSSDGQKFETRRSTFNARHGPKYFGLKKGIVVDTLVINHIPVNAKVIGANEHESHYVFDLLVSNTTSIRPDVHSTDTHGTNEVNFALLHVFGYQFAPRYADLPDRVRTSLYGFQHPSQYAHLTLKPIRKLNTALILEEEDNLLRIFASLALKTTTQSIIVSKLSAHERKNKTQRALWEYNDILQSLYLLDFIDSPPLRQNVQRALNRGESYHQLRRAVSYANFGKLRFRSEEEQQIWSECGRLLANCIIYYSATILSATFAHKEAQGDVVGAEALKHISPVAWPHVNFHGRFEFAKQPAPIDLAGMIQEVAQRPILIEDVEP